MTIDKRKRITCTHKKDTSNESKLDIWMST